MEHKEEAEPIDNEKLIDYLTLMLMQLTSWEESPKNRCVRRTWKSYDWDALDRLADAGLIDFSRKAKSAYLSEDGSSLAKWLIEGYRATMKEPLVEVDQVAARGHRKATVLAEEPADPRVFRFRVELDLDGMPCWRELLVPASFTFLQLHAAIQLCFNWNETHLFDFSLKSKETNLKIDVSDLFGLDTSFDYWGGTHHTSQEKRDASTIRLDEVFPRTKTATYNYDYGDDWEHKVRLVEVAEDASLKKPALMAGDGTAPPEDVGGAWGFAEFLKAINNKAHPDHGAMVEWGAQQGFVRFALKRTQKRLDAGWEQSMRYWNDIVAKR